MVLMRVDLLLGRQQVKWSQLQIIERLDGPAVLPIGCNKTFNACLKSLELGERLTGFLGSFAIYSCGHSFQSRNDSGKRGVACRTNSGILRTKKFLCLR